MNFISSLYVQNVIDMMIKLSEMNKSMLTPRMPKKLNIQYNDQLLSVKDEFVYYLYPYFFLRFPQIFNENLQII